MKRLVRVGLLIIIVASFFQNLQAQILPADRRVNWSLAGLQRNIPSYTTIINITTFGGMGDGITPNDVPLQLALNSVTDSAVIFFPAGTYVFLSPVFLKSGIILRGSDASTTTLQFSLTNNDDCISIIGNNTSITEVTASATKEQSYITVVNPSFFTAGDYFKLFQNDSALVIDAFRTVGQVIQITEVVGDTLKFLSPLRRNYDITFTPKIQKLEMMTGVGIECLKVKRMDATTSQRTNIYYKNAAQCWIKGVEGDSCNFAHVSINNSTNILITGSYFHGAFSYNTGGKGYGVAVQNTTGECLIENNIFRHLRHAMLLQAGANGNVFGYNYSREPFKSETFPFDLAGDIVLHGNYPYANLFEGNIVQNIVLDNSHFINGPNNTFFRNRAELYGFLMSTGSADSTNVIGNEITNTTPNYGNYIMKGNGNIEYGNNKLGTIIPAGTNNLTDNSYYYTSTPQFWNVTSTWPSIGIPNTIGSGTIPAKERYQQASFTICSSLLTLPVHIVSFTAKEGLSGNVLEWIVNGNISSYTVERSNNGIAFESLKNYTNSINTDVYRYTDNNWSTGKNYYRISITTDNGRKIYSKVLLVDNGKSKVLVVYPNPAKDFIQFSLKGTVRKANVIIKNITGETIISKKEMIIDQVSKVDISSLKKGIYTVQVYFKDNGETVVQKIVKQ